MNFENFLEGLEILNSCLVVGFRFDKNMSYFATHKEPNANQKVRLKALGFSSPFLQEWNYYHSYT